MAATAPAVAAPPTEAFVDAAGVCGGQTPCFMTIQDGVNHVAASMSSAGIVFVAQGTYPESVDISQMGSAVGGMPGDLAIFTGLSLTAIENLFNNPQSMVDPAAGPAFFNSTSPFPGTVVLGGFKVVSKDSDGINLHTADSVSLLDITADDNFIDGLRIQTDGTADLFVFGGSANENRAVGADFSVGGQVILSGFPSLADTLPERFGPTASAMMQELATMPAHMMASLGIATAPVTTGATLTPFTANGNKTTGFQVTAGKQVFMESVAANENGSFGFDIVAGGSVAVFFGSANENEGSGFHLSSTTDDVGLFNVTALTNNPGDGITIPNATVALVVDSYVRGNSQDGINISTVGPGNAGVGNQVVGGIICSNGGVGLRLGSNVPLDATGDWWGSTLGPFHPTKNPTGTGNAVADGTNGGVGDVTFIPFIDTVTATLVGETRVGTPDPRRVQFSGGGGTVFLGSFLGGPGDPLGELPFTIATDNGVVSIDIAVEALAQVMEQLTGPTIGARINRANGVLEFTLTADHEGIAKVTVNGPCGLGLAQAIILNAIRLAVPALSGIALLLLGSLLAWSGFQIARRRSEH